MKTDRERQGLNGPVKILRVETAEFEERDGQIVEKPWLSHAATFNQDGWIVEQVDRNPDGSEWRTGATIILMRASCNRQGVTTLPVSLAVR